MFVFAVVCIEVLNSQMPVWALVLALIIGTSFIRVCTHSSRLMSDLYSLCLHRPDRYDSGYHQPTDRSQVRCLSRHYNHVLT